MIILLIALCYTFLMLWLVWGISRLKVFQPAYSFPTSTFSICIPFRNEAENLPCLFQSLSELDYPSEKFEILLINDHSEDDSVEKCLQFIRENPQLQIQLLQNKKESTSPKKDALLKAIQQSKSAYILTTDADCVVSKNWLNLYNDEISRNSPDFIAGPVTYKPESSFLNKFQQLDFLSLQGATLGGFGNQHPFLCNGANLCYSRQAFFDVNAFADNEKIASGDDIFLLEKMQKTRRKVAYLATPEASVETIPPQNFSALIAQRIRWAAKTSAYKNRLSQGVGIVVSLMNIGLILSVFAGLTHWLPWYVFLVLFMSKFNVDFIVLYQTAGFYRKQEILKNYLLMAFLHPVFIGYVAIVSLFSGYRWKGRNFKK